MKYGTDHAFREDAVEMLLDAAAVDLGDRFTFALERADEETDLPGGGQRWRVAATLAGRIFERTVIDVAFARRAGPGTGPDHDIRPARVRRDRCRRGPDARDRAAPRVEASPLHAHVRARVKDLVDVVVIANTSVIGAAKLAEAITAIFKRRAEHPVPAALPEPPAEWATPWRRLARDVQPPTNSPRVTALLLRCSTRSWQPPSRQGRGDPARGG